MAYHYKSMQTFENMSVRTTLTEQVERETILKNKQLDAIKATQNNNAELADVFKNGTSHDDISATKSIKSNNQLAIELARMSTGTDTSNALLKQAEKTAHQNKNTLLLLFMTVELFSLFGIIAKGLLSSETGETVKSVITTSEKLATLEENVLQVVETGMINSTMQRIEATVNHSPTPTYATGNNSQNQPDKAQIAFNANSNYNNTRAYENSGFTPNYTQYLGYSQTLSEAKPEFNNDACDPCIDEVPKNLKNKINLEKPKNKTLDLMKYNYQDSQIILALFDNGTIEKGGRLVKKTLVLAELEDHGVKEDDYTSLTRRLRKQKLITFNVGYYSNCDLENIITQKNK